MDRKFKKELENFLDSKRPIKYKKGELIFRPGDSIENGIYIKSGFLRAYTVCKDGQEVTLNLFRPSSLLPTFFCPEKTLCSYYLEALTPVEVIRLPRQEMMEMIGKDKELLVEFLDNTFSECREMLNRVESLASGDAYSKVVSVLLSVVKGSKKADVPVGFALTHRLIASMTGLTRETVTLQMLKLKKQGFITGKGKHTRINDIDRLKEEVNCPEELEE